jgi:glycerophosphoryl diester phosphodiesterase
MADIDEKIEAVRMAGYFVRKNENRYDRQDAVRRVAVIHAGGLKVAAYQVRDPETDAWLPLQFHMAYDNTVLGIMGGETAKLFAKFVTDTLAEPTP